MQNKARALNLDRTGGQLTDDEMKDMGSRVAAWVWEQWVTGKWSRQIRGHLDFSNSEAQAARARKKAKSVRAKNAEHDALIRQFSASGMSKREIARGMGWSESTIRAVLKDSPEAQPLDRKYG